MPRYRSGAVARMLRMPVATLRIWERRYNVASPATSPSGHRLYSAADVKRLALLRQLTALGHAIGSLAGLDLNALHQVAATHAGVLSAPRRAPLGLPAAEAPALAESRVDAAVAPLLPAVPRADEAALAGSALHAGAGVADGSGGPGRAEAPARPAPADGADVAGAVSSRAGASPAAPWRVLVVGAALARRLERAPLRQRLARPLEVVQVCETLEEAARAPALAAAEALLVQCAAPRPQDLPLLQAVAQGCGAQRMHLLYGFAASALCASFEAAGVALLRAPQDDRALATWLQGSCSPLELPLVVAPRRWDDAALADFAGLSSTISCECPRHVAELLMQLSSFEAYSAECAQRSPADAALHTYLGQVSGTARALFEQALERLATQEGLTLPGLTNR
ncbi:MerR family transcriptional regulator [Azohydromonas sp. G-1-1-14]|uniref:MerR family transcriptional regulator n=2 Tax=Azohydromonas caseinilytica TaxID=2728836 RepID=A0A848F7C0_9BURK|nr:MerR family transcriptional regulator [Azohydromonas caseinilytica]